MSQKRHKTGQGRNASHKQSESLPDARKSSESSQAEQQTEPDGQAKTTSRDDAESRFPLKRDRVAAWLKRWNVLLQLLIPGILSLAVLAVIVVQAIIYGRQAKLMSAGIQESVQTREIQNRAYVNLNVIHFDKPLSEKHNLTLFYQFENSGSTPALNVQATVYQGVYKVGDWETMEWDKNMSDQSLPALKQAGYVFDETAVLPSRMPFKGESPITWDGDLLRGYPVRRYHLFGTVEYCDIFGKRWKVEFCFYNSFDSSVEFTFCPIRNSYSQLPAQGKCQNPN